TTDEATAIAERLARPEHDRPIVLCFEALGDAVLPAGIDTVLVLRGEVPLPRVWAESVSNLRRDERLPLLAIVPFRARGLDAPWIFEADDVAASGASAAELSLRVARLGRGARETAHERTVDAQSLA